jgi:hypothetical protein
MAGTQTPFIAGPLWLDFATKNKDLKNKTTFILDNKNTIKKTRMDSYSKIEKLIAKKYGKETTTRKAVGDFMLTENHAVNVKSNNVDKQNYSPNMISIKKMHLWVFEEKKDISFVFVDYKEKEDEFEILKESGLIPIEEISWDCLSIEAQGYGVIQKTKALITIPNQTKRDFYKGFLAAYKKYREKELKKHERFSKRFIKNPDNIDW